MLHHLARALRAPHFQRHCAPSPGPTQPAREPKICEPNQMIGMMVRQEYSVDRAERHADLIETLHRPAPGIEQEFPDSDLDQRAGPEAVDEGRRRAAAQQRDSKTIRRLAWHERILLRGLLQS